MFAANRKLQQYAAETGRDVGAYVLYTLVLEETEAEAQAKSDHWIAHADREALATMMGQAALDAAGGRPRLLQAIAYIGITPIIASYAQCAAILDRIGAVPGTKGIMLIFPECAGGAPGVRRAGAAAHAHGQAGTPAGAAGAGLKVSTWPPPVPVAAPSTPAIVPQSG